MRSALAVVLGLVILAPVLLLTLIASGSGQIVYALDHGTLTVDSGSRMDGRRTVPLTLVHEPRVVVLHGARRTRGTGMPGYCTGRWSYADLGDVWQATDCSGRAVLVPTVDGDLPLVVTPPDPEAFVRALETSTDFSVLLPPADTTVLRILPAVAAVLALLTGGMVFATLWVGPSRMRYLVGEGRLEVITIFGRRSWPTSQLRARPHTPRVTLRLAGTAVRGYYTGIFRADGETTRLYATELRDGVLVEGPQRVYLSPEHRDAFLDALRSAGATVDGDAGAGHS